jgi:hypothetical protein
MSIKQWQYDNDRGKPKYSEKNMPQYILPPQTHGGTGLGLNPGLPGESSDEIEARTSVYFLIRAEICANSSNQWFQHCFTLKLILDKAFSQPDLHTVHTTCQVSIILISPHSFKDIPPKVFEHS